MPDHALPNRWQGTQDPRFEGLKEIASSIEDAWQTEASIEDVVDSFFQSGGYSSPAPLQLADLMEQAAKRIRQLTVERS